MRSATAKLTRCSYKGFFDAAHRTYQREGFFGFYRGLVPSLAMVVPAVSISYVVYEQVRSSVLRTPGTILTHTAEQAPTRRRIGP